MGPALSRIHNTRLTRVLAVTLFVIVGLVYFSRAYGAELPGRSLLLSDNQANATGVGYVLGFTVPATETIGSIKLQICSNNPLIGEPCTAPGGFNMAAATLASQSGATGFTILPAGTNADTIVLTRIPSTASPGSVSYTLTGIVNPSAEGTYFGRLQTFPTVDASGPENDHGGMAFSINSSIQVSTTVPPYLLFCSGVTIGGFDCSAASGNYINFGNLASSATASAESQLLTATNAASGFNITVNGATMTSGNNIINSMNSPDVSRPGLAQFGVNLVANQTPSVGENPQGTGSASPTSGYSQANLFKFTSGDILADAPAADAYRKFNVSYIINIPNGQTPGVYVTTLTYICLANF